MEAGIEGKSFLLLASDFKGVQSLQFMQSCRGDRCMNAAQQLGNSAAAAAGDLLSCGSAAKGSDVRGWVLPVPPPSLLPTEIRKWHFISGVPLNV